MRLAFKIPGGRFWQSVSKRISEIRDSFPGFLKCLGGFGRFSTYRPVSTWFLKNFSVLREAGVLVIKRAGGAVAVFLSMAMAIFDFFHGYLKNRCESWKSKRDKR